jgi:hypothetical protein
VYPVGILPNILEVQTRKGHQVDHAALESPDRCATLNIEMDAKAKKRMAIAKRTPKHYLIASEPWSLWFNGRKIILDLPTMIYDLVHANSTKNYWMQKDNLTSEVIESVNWELIAVAMNETKKSRRVCVSKHTSGMYGVGKFMKCWKSRQTTAYLRMHHTCGCVKDQG